MNIELLQEMLNYYGLYVYYNKPQEIIEIAESKDDLTFIVLYPSIQEVYISNYRHASKESLMNALTILNTFKNFDIQ